MPATTTVRVSPTTRDAVKALAETDGVTFDEEIRRLARAERQRRMGEELANYELTEEDEAWIRLGAEAVRLNERG